MKDNEALVTLEPVKYPVSIDEIKAFVEANKEVTPLDETIGIKADAYKDIKKLHLQAVTFRTGIEKKRKELCAPALSYNKEVNKIAKEYTEMLEDTERRLSAERTKVEHHERVQEQKRIDEERVRVEKIGDEILKLKMIPSDSIGKTSKELTEIYGMIKIPDEEIFAERLNEALETYKDTISKLETQIEQTKQAEESERLMAEEKARQAEAKAKVDAEIAEEREAFRLEKEAFDKEKKEAQAQKDAEAEAEAKAKAEKELAEMEAQQEAEAQALQTKLQGEVDKEVQATIESLAEHIGTAEAIILTGEIIQGSIANVTYTGLKNGNS